MSFADFVKAHRAKSGMSQRALASALKVSPGYVAQWELGINAPTPELVEKLCKVLGVKDRDAAQLLAYTEKAPELVREAMHGGNELSALESRVVELLRALPERERERLADRIEAWADGATRKARR